MKTKSIVVIGLILAIVASALFLVVKITTLFICAYIIALFGIALLCMGTVYLFKNPGTYPWFAAFPMVIKIYLTLQLTLSAIFIISENIYNRSFSVNWFILLHIALLAFFAILLVVLKVGKDVIVKREAVVKEKVTALRFMQLDVESLMRKFPAYEKDLRQVRDELRYSDPMSHPSLAYYEEQIQREIAALNDGKDIAGRASELLRLIADRNSRVKVMK